MTVCDYEQEIIDLKQSLKLKDETILQLEDENLQLKDKQQSSSSSTSLSLQKVGKTFPVDVRLFVYDCAVNNVPTGNIPKLLTQFGKRSGHIFDVPHRNTIEYMTCGGLGIISDN